MAFEELKDNIDYIREEGDAYLDTSIAYFKLLGFKMVMKSTTFIIKFFLTVVCIMMVLIFGSIAGALAIGKVMESTVGGFLVVFGFYVFLTLIFFLVRNKVVDSPLLRRFSRSIFNH